MLQVNIKNLIDDVQCYKTVRELRWPDGVACPSCESQHVIKRGFDDTEPARQRYECHDCDRRFDALTDTMFAGHHQPLTVWVLCMYFMGLNVSNEQIAHSTRPGKATTLDRPFGKTVITRFLADVVGAKMRLPAIQGVLTVIVIGLGARLTLTTRAQPNPIAFSKFMPANRARSRIPGGVDGGGSGIEIWKERIDRITRRGDTKVDLNSASALGFRLHGHSRISQDSSSISNTQARSLSACARVKYEHSKREQYFQ